mgnify:CR=1 FL=1
MKAAKDRVGACGFCGEGGACGTSGKGYHGPRDCGKIGQFPGWEFGGKFVASSNFR